MSAPDNPTVFPQSMNAEGPYGGMTLRDWFAGQALAGDIASYAGVTEGLPLPETVAERAYRHADAMLSVRSIDLPKPSSPAPPAKPLGGEWKCEHGFDDLFDCETCKPF